MSNNTFDLIKNNAPKIPFDAKWLEGKVGYEDIVVGENAPVIKHGDWFTTVDTVNTKELIILGTEIGNCVFYRSSQDIEDGVIRCAMPKSIITKYKDLDGKNVSEFAMSFFVNESRQNRHTEMELDSVYNERRQKYIDAFYPNAGIDTAPKGKTQGVCKGSNIVRKTCGFFTSDAGKIVIAVTVVHLGYYLCKKFNK